MDKKNIKELSLNQKKKYGYVVMIQKRSKDGTITTIPYETVSYRLMQFREDHKNWPIITKEIKRLEQSIIVECQISDVEGRIMSVAQSEAKLDGHVPALEKASTAALGRALVQLGYATDTMNSYDEMAGQGIERTMQQTCQQKKFNMPNPYETGWEKQRVGFKKTGDLTWLDLANNATLTDGKSGLEYLKGLAGWNDHPEVAEVAKAALALSEKKQ